MGMRSKAPRFKKIYNSQQPRDYGGSIIDAKNNFRFNQNKCAEDSSYEDI
jgi:hypothetical protein